MKKTIVFCLTCVFFLLTTFSVGFVYAFKTEHLEFEFNGRVFNYYLNQNTKENQVFSIDYELNKFSRFGSIQERIALLKHMLNLNFDGEIALNYIFPKLTDTIDKIEKNVFTPAKNATIKTNTNSEKVFSYTNEIEGKVLDRNKLINNIILSYISNQSLNFTVPTITISPQVKKSDLNADKFLLSDFSTDISQSTTDRKHNIKNALSSLNLVSIAPNQTFSFNKTVGRRTLENGYREAKIILNNEFVEGVGGGVCQVSSTLYNSALLAGLQIIEANKHSKQVSYVKNGFDAMVNFGSSDLKFLNNTSKKITIITNYSPQKARIRIFGEDARDNIFKLSNEIFNIVEPAEEIFVDEKQEHLDKVEFEDEFFYLKKPNKGMEIKSYREHYKNNILISKELLRHDKFLVQNAIKVFGSKKRTSPTQSEHSYS